MTFMNCRELKELATEYLEQALPGPKRAAFEEHLAECAACQKYVADMRALIASSQDLGNKIDAEWRTRAPATQETFFEDLQARTSGRRAAEHSRYRKLAPVAAATVLAIIAALLIHERPRQKSLTIDLSQWLLFRGPEQPPGQHPVQLERARLNLTIRLPVGEEPGEYEVALSRGETVVAQAKGEGSLEPHITTLHVMLDCSSLKAGAYVLNIRQDQGSWSQYPVIIH